VPHDDLATDGPVPGLVLLRWRDTDAPSEASVARRLREEGVEPYAWSNGPGDRYPPHEHPYEKVLVCATGSIEFVIGREATRVELRAGDGFVLAPGTTHSAVVGRAGVTCLEGSR
jgi:quercetin dioxygenase-like cupin family protein